MFRTLSARSVLVVSQRSLLRVAIHSILAAMDLDNLGEASDKASAAELLRTEQPAVIIVDFGGQYNQAAGSYVRWIRAHPHNPKVLAICSASISHGGGSASSGDIDSGCLFVTHEVDAAELAAAVKGLLEVGSSHERATSMRVHLTPRQREVLALVATGRSNAEIGERLVIASGTVKRHLNDVFAVLNARSRIDAVNRARLLGLM